MYLFKNQLNLKNLFQTSWKYFWFINTNFLFIFFAEAERARDSLNGRYFGGRLVKGELYDQALYDHLDYSG